MHSLAALILFIHSFIHSFMHTQTTLSAYTNNKDMKQASLPLLQQHWFASNPHARPLFLRTPANYQYPSLTRPSSLASTHPHHTGVASGRTTGRAFLELPTACLACAAGT